MISIILLSCRWSILSLLLNLVVDKCYGNRHALSSWVDSSFNYWHLLLVISVIDIRIVSTDDEVGLATLVLMMVA